ncbi:hypothetical protein HanRHA438_Chr01g0038591 [Helianthus annuus]|uniref:Uncharacterized protein n=1 Tax=Helianthus annuus TaxID=4232 RepID=A0A9K3P3I8_HELAN|nr:hypothetical protein HanXRQr2_Chr01g0037661 [Helianthus annuus]KAJ0612732.1 hypothetical protein HanHA300_Chr01g0030681 [Helianthus annuus]KAJ0628099.1 hypothetical protein HanHA89_Chr01g0033041 [Helianthus annuus]KAJ0784387.1 hypothetical protein HanLR1_Chr01g0031541 [Helianthus annuus]KAJ0949430.1 hypothetical protein HanRHA438_Chr01g0038591 [Helianthus annuus]
MVTPGPEKGKTVADEPSIVIAPPASVHTSELPEGNVQRDEEKIEHQESEIRDVEEETPIRLDETLDDYYYRSYTEKKAANLDTPVWKLKQCDTFVDWQVCWEWFKGVFPPSEIKFQEEQTYERTYHAYLQESAHASSTTHGIVREWRNMQKEWEAFEASKKEIAVEKAQMAVLKTELEADKAKFEDEQKTEEWSAMGWKKKAEAEAALLAEERKRWKEACERDNNEKRTLRNEAVNLKAEIEKLKKEKTDVETVATKAWSHRERSEQKEVETCETLAHRNKEIAELTSLLLEQEQTKEEHDAAKKDLQLVQVEKAELARRLSEIDKKLEDAETARVTAESIMGPLTNNMLWMQHHGVINIVNSIMNSIKLDESVAKLMVT